MHCNFDSVCRLVGLGYDVNRSGFTRGYSERRPLAQAVEFECLELMEVLLAHGADTELLDGDSSALQLAACNGCLAATAVLIQWGTNINVTSLGSSQTLPLYFALISCNLAIAKLLLECWCHVPLAFLHADDFDLDANCLDEEETDELTALLQRNATCAKPLAILCRTCIVSRMRTCRKTRDDIKYLPLPSKLQRFLRFEELDSAKEESLL